MNISSTPSEVFNYIYKNFSNGNDLGILPTCFTSDHVEEGERVVADLFTNPNSCVLEFGGGSGAVSTVIQQKLNNPSDHVVIQPIDGNDSESPMFGGVNILERNIKSCNLQCHVIDHILNKGEGVELLKLVSKPFDTLVVDCEGCLIEEYNKNPDIFDNVTMIQVERDDIVLNTPSYETLFKTLNMKKIHTGKGCGVRCATEVWVR